MSQNRLSQISFVFPHDTPEAQAFYGDLHKLLSEDVRAHPGQGTLVIPPRYPAGAMPSFAIAVGDVLFPQVVFETAKEIDLYCGRMRIRSSAMPANKPAPTNLPPEKIPGATVPLSKVWSGLSGHIMWMEHSGIELNANGIERGEWQRLAHQLGEISALYRYPSGEAWPYILPTTDYEQRLDIEEFAALRSPKFEVTYGYVSQPLLQFHLDTDLPREKVDALFPEPYSFYLPGADTFRSVYVENPWKGLSVRVDMTYATNEGLTDWQSGEWLVRQGGRLH